MLPVPGALPLRLSALSDRLMRSCKIFCCRSCASRALAALLLESTRSSLAPNVPAVVVLAEVCERRERGRRTSGRRARRQSSACAAAREERAARARARADSLRAARAHLYRLPALELVQRLGLQLLPVDALLQGRLVLRLHPRAVGRGVKDAVAERPARAEGEGQRRRGSAWLDGMGGARAERRAAMHSAHFSSRCWKMARVSRAMCSAFAATRARKSSDSSTTGRGRLRVSVRLRRADVSKASRRGC